MQWLPRGWRLVLDALVLAWVVAWVALAGAVGADVRQLASTGAAFVQLANGEDALAASLDPLNHVPFVQLNLRALTDQLHDASASARAGALTEARAIEDGARLLELGTLGLGLFPVLFVYAPLRAAGLIEVTRLRREDRRHRGDPDFEAYLAHRAVAFLPYSRLRAFTDAPGRDLAQGRWSALADAERARLGLRRSRRRAGDRELA